MIETTTRQTGYGGTAHCGSTAGASDVYNSAAIEEWSEDVTVEVEDMTALNDLDGVFKVTKRTRKGTIKKMVAGSVEFLERILSDPVIYLDLKLGSGPGATVGSGTTADSGMAILTGVGLNNARGKTLENVSFLFTGESTA
jgi:hypothetical protein